MANNLKDSIRNHYQGYSLDEFQVEKLLSIKRKHKFSRSFLFSSGAVIASLLALFFMHAEVMPIEKKIVEEIAYNHNKQLEPEFLNSKISDIQSALARVDFKLIESQELNPTEWKIRGARYCSIQGNIAAQIKLEKVATGELYTMYQAKVPNGLKLEAYKEDIDGVTVRFWREKGLLIGIAGK